MRRLQGKLADAEREAARSKDQLTAASHAQVAELQAEVSQAKAEHKSREHELRLKDQHIDNVEKQLKHEKEQSASALASLGAALDGVKFVWHVC